MAASAPPVSYRFGRFELQPRERRLLIDGVAANLGPRGFDLLAMLVERAGHLVTKDELFERVWPKVVVDDSALQFQISSLRKTLGAETIATVSGRGYRFALDVVTVDDADGGADAAPRHNLPQGLASFVGRQRDAARLRQLLDRSRLVTLTGAGGCGKTRLAIEVASALVQRYDEGVWFVELASLADASHVPQAVMGVLGVKETLGSTPLESLLAHLSARRLLLLLDNAEHLLAGCAELVDGMLQRCPGIGVLVTSRQALGVIGEQTYRVPSLSLPDITQPVQAAGLPAFESVQLFVDRARLLRPHFVVTPQNASAVALVCWRLDGIPLAIELAAGRMRSMPVEELSQRLNQRFSLLSGGAHGKLPRHRTLRSLIDWSYDLLSGTEQALLCRLSVFAGGATLAAAEQVCCHDGADATQVLDGLAALVDKNLLVIDEPDGATRYRLLETVRQYAAERLHEGLDAARWRDRHWAHFLALVREALPHNHGPEQKAWFDRFEADNDNLRAALSWSLTSGNTVEGLRLASALSNFWIVRGYLTEARGWLDTLLAAVPVDQAAKQRAIALGIVGTLATMQGDYVGAKASGEEALRLFRGLGDRLRIACALNNLAMITEYEGDLASAEGLFVEAVAMFRADGYTSNLARALPNLANVMCRLGDTVKAQALLAEALSVARQEGIRQAEGAALGHLGAVALLDGRPGEARALFCASLTILSELGDRVEALEALEGLAHLDACAGAASRSARLWGSAEQLRDALGLARPPARVAEYTRRVAAARAAMGDEAAFDGAWQEGRTLTFKAAVGLAVSPPGA